MHAGKTLVSGKGESTRPMMEKVRAAVFDMLLAHTTGTNMLPAESRWLDLFAGVCPGLHSACELLLAIAHL